MGQAARQASAGKEAEPWAALCSTSYSNQREAARTERRRLGWDSCTTKLLSTAPKPTASLSGPRLPPPAPPPPTAKEGLDPVFSHQPGFSSAQDLQLVPGPAISDRLCS